MAYLQMLHELQAGHIIGNFQELSRNFFHLISRREKSDDPVRLF